MVISRDAAAALSTRLYQEVLGRDPDPAGLEYWTSALAAGGLDEAGLRAAMASSPEGAARVSGLYAGVLGRPADLPGAAQYGAALGAGTLTLAGVRAAMASSPEATARVNALYAEVLGRPADVVGAAQYQAALGAGTVTLAGVRAALASSLEAGGVMAGAYLQALGRPADASGLAAALAALRGGAALATLRAGLAASPEATESLIRADRYGFGLSPDPATLATQVQELSAGRPFGDTVTVTERQSGSSGLFNEFGYAIPAAYSGTGADAFLTIVPALGFTPGLGPARPVPVVGPVDVPAGPDTIVLDLQRSLLLPALAFVATLDGQRLGGATVDAHRTAQPHAAILTDEVTFKATVGPGLHRLTLQIADAPFYPGLIVERATLNGVSVLRQGSAATDGSTLDLFLRTDIPPVVVVQV